MQREPKKTETLEVRLSPETKSAFMSACRTNGVSASTVLRACIDRYLGTVARPPITWTRELAMLFTGRSRYSRAVTASVGSFAVGATAITFASAAFAATDPRLTAVFEWIDTNRDNRISATEFHASTVAAPPFGAISVVIDTKIAPPTGETRDALFGRLDGNGDRHVELGELSEASSIRTVAGPAISAADTNQDRQLSEGELAAYLALEASAAGAPDPAQSAGLLARGIVAERDGDQDGLVTLDDLQH